MRGVKYIGPVGDFSGYGEASRNYIFALHAKGIPVTVSPRNFDPNPPPIADENKRLLLGSLIDKQISYDVVIIHLTPDLYPLYAEKSKYNIGFAAWETSLIHPKWAGACSVLDELWVPCEWNAQAFLDSGVKIPIYKVPHGIDTNMFSELKNKEFTIRDLPKSTFKFYSIFQWIYRKNPEGLLRAYFNAFTSEDSVVLILKTYMAGMSRDKSFLKEKILEIKKDMNIGYYPKVILIGDLLSNTQMMGLHLYGDCCVCLHRGEGWGLPLFEAGLAGNPVIATDCGGNVEFMDNDNSYLVNSHMTYVSHMSTFNPWYLGNQEWAEPSLVHASKLMRRAFDNREESTIKGTKLKNNIKDKFSWGSVSDVIVDRLGSIK